ncbi:M48 family metalloprotease [Streptomyces sp. SKN60]|uniref:M48 family metalloprotease n=1 Tax=Streptomyces sp. SKN60 TaxID=2855506 RepID=UPI00224714BF|nr:M48 family metalloprotease [Streptomyces sp. SKN60]MCX2182793.1 M48 family metalloprotease [Streptomyces sp. SKN60]
MTKDTSGGPTSAVTGTGTAAGTATATGTRGAEPTARDCPDCGERIPVDSRFVTWCTACGWNVDPEDATPDEPEPDRVERLRRTLAHRYGEQLFADLAAAPGADGPAASRPTGGAALLATVLALAVHGLTVGLAVLGLWLLVARWGEGLQPAVGGLLLALAFVLRPRFGRLRKGSELPLLESADAPRLFALIDEIGVLVGTRGVDVVVLDADVNAFVSAYGIRRRRVLVLGMPLWATLDPQERIALLGHELGHYAHGDTRHGFLVGSALGSLDTWRYMLARSEDGDSLSDAFINVLTAPPRWAVHGLTLLLDGATLRAAQRAEYLADGAAARTAGRDAAVGFLQRLLVYRSTGSALRREIVAARTRVGGRARREVRAEGLWQRVAAEVRTVPEREYERLHRVAELRGHRVDSTHPPTHLRIRNLARGELRAPALVLDPDRAAALEAELAAPAQKVAALLLRDGGA